MVKVAYNGCYGGFSLSDEAVILGRKISGDPKWAGLTIYGEMFSDGSGPCSIKNNNHPYDLPRNDTILIEVIETLKEKANGSCANLQIKEISKGTQYRIDEYDGNESVETKDSYNWNEA